MCRIVIQLHHCFAHPVLTYSNRQIITCAVFEATATYGAPKLATGVHPALRVPGRGRCFMDSTCLVRRTDVLSMRHHTSLGAKTLSRQAMTVRCAGAMSLHPSPRQQIANLNCHPSPAHCAPVAAIESPLKRKRLSMTHCLYAGSAACVHQPAGSRSSSAPAQAAGTYAAL